MHIFKAAGPLTLIIEVKFFISNDYSGQEMIELFLEKVREKYPERRSSFQGYNDLELDKLKELYNIKISGQFNDFMHCAGRSAGGVINDHEFVIYRTNWSVRDHLLFQSNFFTRLQDIWAVDFMEKPFVLTVESERDYYFLQTGGVEPDLICHLDEVSGTVQNTGVMLADFLVNRLKKSMMLCLESPGELLII